MPLATNLTNRTYLQPFTTVDTILRAFLNANFPVTTTAQTEVEGAYDSMAPWFVHYGNMILQTWAETVVPSEMPLLGSSVSLGGSGILTVAFQLQAVMFLLTQVPVGANQQPGAPNRYPYIGNVAFFAEMPGANGLFEEEHLTLTAHLKFAQKRVAQGIYYRLNPGYRGFFLFYGNGASNLTQPYRYNTGSDPAGWKYVNVYNNQGAEFDL